MPIAAKTGSPMQYMISALGGARGVGGVEAAVLEQQRDHRLGEHREEHRRRHGEQQHEPHRGGQRGAQRRACRASTAARESAGMLTVASATPKMPIGSCMSRNAQ